VDTYQQRNPYAKGQADRFNWLKDKSRLDRTAKRPSSLAARPPMCAASSASESVRLLDNWVWITQLRPRNVLRPPADVRRRSAVRLPSSCTIISKPTRSWVWSAWSSFAPACQMTFFQRAAEVLGESMPFETLNLVELVAEEIKSGRIELPGCRPGRS